MAYTSPKAILILLFITNSIKLIYIVTSDEF